MEPIMKNENIAINEHPYLQGIPVEFESDDPWRKKRLSCSGAGRVEKNFDLEHLNYMAKFNGVKPAEDED
jgi:hypothetical protein